MPIGETLAQARRQAGLTLTQVSRRTRIRETIIRKIEEDDFAECGGDFYARGHIRAIAKSVGTDPEPLIQEYDSDHRATGPIAAVSLDELLATSGPQRHRPGLPTARTRGVASAPGARQAGAGAARGRVSSGHSAGPGPATPRSAGPGPATPPSAGPGPATPPRVASRTARWAVFVCLALIVVALGFVALHVLAGPPPKAATSASGKQAVTGHHAGHGRPGPAAQASHRAASPAAKASHTASPSPAPSRAPSRQAQPLIPVQAVAFGPNGGDNPQLAHSVLGGGHRAGWHTDWYNSARFGNLYPGTGLLLKMGRTVTITSARIDLGSAVGASVQLRVGGTPTMTGLHRVAHASGAGGVVHLRLASPARGRYVLVWFTRLPADSSGTFQASVHSVALRGHG